MTFIEISKDFLLVCLVFIPLERLLALRHDQKIFRRGWVVDLTHVFATGFIYWLGTGLLILALGGVLEGLVPEPVRHGIGSQPIWLAVIEILLIADIGFYFVHRAFHASSFLWRFHAIHHSIEEMDFLAAHRVHPFDQILTRGATLLPVFALGFAPEAIALFSVLYHWQALLIHSNVRIDIGPLRWIIASPVFHHWHHANHPESVDKNFAGQISLLDLLFGTLYLPRADRPRRYGINSPVPPSYLGHLLHPFKCPPTAPAQQRDAAATGY